MGGGVVMWRVDNRGEKNPAYKGDAVGYEAVHAWVRRRKPQPDVCDFCGIADKIL